MKGFEWTFSTRVKERACFQCRTPTSGFLTNLRTGIRKPLCADCFLSCLKEAGLFFNPIRKSPSSDHKIPYQEKLKLC